MSCERIPPGLAVELVNVDALRTQLSAVEAELEGLGDRRKALEKAAGDLRKAIDSVSALDDDAPAPRKRGRKKSSATRPARPSVTPEDLTGALQELGGEASVEQLVEKLGLPDGRSLNGARRIAVEAGTVSYADRTYTLTG